MRKSRMNGAPDSGGLRWVLAGREKIPQRLKPVLNDGIYGMAKAMPLRKRSRFARVPLMRKSRMNGAPDSRFDLYIFLSRDGKVRALHESPP
ncbi:hypothetical protein Terro_0640 [Terriglobus roseus DSM 18391]|uniref:Uncharacterized protein n=1 Tax=Terriglobus roseus (strain DSM 18391 / NRRL B-41598 / KBS 63) TaxID=926566 RepID=I3ZCK9_TERRK|nr:hypothetical protein Terro_0640 [Terriglobus roseus DSM 18391]